MYLAAGKRAKRAKGGFAHPMRAALLLLLIAVPCRGAVSLVAWIDDPAAPVVKIYLTAWGESGVTGLDYRLTPTPTFRDLADSSFTDPLRSSLDGDLGATVDDVTAPVGDGLYLVAMYAVDTSAGVGIVPMGDGWAAGPPDFSEAPFAQLIGAKGMAASIPEPVALALILLGMIALRRRGKV